MNQKGLPWIVGLTLAVCALLLLRPSVASPSSSGPIEAGTAISDFIPEPENPKSGHVIIASKGMVYLVKKNGSSLTVMTCQPLP